MPTAEHQWAASQLVQGASQEPAERATGTCQNGKQQRLHAEDY